MGRSSYERASASSSLIVMIEDASRPLVNKIRRSTIAQMYPMVQINVSRDESRDEEEHEADDD